MTRGPGRPATGQVPVHSIRCGPVWEEAKAAAALNDQRFSDFLELALRHEIDRQARARDRRPAQ